MFDEYKDLYVDMRPQIMDQQWTNCHFDFERRNIHLLDNGDLALVFSIRIIFFEFLNFQSN